MPEERGYPWQLFTLRRRVNCVVLRILSKRNFQYREVPGGEEVCRAQLLFYADKIMAAEPKETMDRYQQELFEKFEVLSKEELIQKLVSFEFGKLLKNMHLWKI